MNLFEKLNPSVKSKIIADKDEYPSLIDFLLNLLQECTSTDQLPMEAANRIFHYGYDTFDSFSIDKLNKLFLN